MKTTDSLSGRRQGRPELGLAGARNAVRLPIAPRMVSRPALAPVGAAGLSARRVREFPGPRTNVSGVVGPSMGRRGWWAMAAAMLIMVLASAQGFAATTEGVVPRPPGLAPLAPPAPSPPEQSPPAAPPRIETPAPQPPATTAPAETQPPEKAPTPTTPQAEVPPPMVTEEEVPPAPPEGPPTEEEAPTAPRKPLEGPIVLNFKDASLRTVLEYLSEAAGLVVVQEATVEGRVTVMSLQPLNVEEAVSLLNTILKEKGFAAVRTGRTLKIVSLDQAKKAALPVRSGVDPDKIEPSDQLVTYVIPIQFADATQLRRDLATLVPTYADMSANASTNTLIVTDTQTNVRRFVEIIKALDSRMAAVAEVKVFQLKYANAANAARLITDLFRQDQTGQQAGRFGGPFGAIQSFMMGGRGGPGGPPSQADQQTSRLQKVTASSDDRTNTLVVSAPPDQMKVIEGVIRELDANPSEEQAVFTYPLKNAKAVNLESVLNNLFGWSGGTTGRATTTTGGGTQFRPGTGGTGFGGSSMGGMRPGGSSSGGFGSSGFGSGGFGSTRTGAGGFGSSGLSSTSFTSSRGGTTQARGTTRISPTTMQAASDLAGQVFVVADADTNSLLVTAATKNFDRIKAILEELDRPTPQVLIKVLIAEVTHDDSLDLGAEFSVLNMNAAGTKGDKYGTDFSVAAQTGGLTIKLLHDDYTVTLRALATMGKVDVLSRPYILTSDNQEAWIQVGQYVPFIAYTQLTEAGTTNNSYQWQDIGIILDVVPHINPDGLVIMDVYQEISNLTDVPVPVSTTVTAQALNKRAAQSRVAIRDGQTIVIGGLMADRSTDNVRKVPLLGDIPALGALFRRTQTTKTKTELLIFLTPHVATVPDDLKGMSEDEAAASKVIRNAVEPGAFEDHMKGMQRGAAPPRPQAEKRQAAPVKSVPVTPPAPPQDVERQPTPGKTETAPPSPGVRNEPKP
jgi:general secretion pathway protein D